MGHSTSLLSFGLPTPKNEDHSCRFLKSAPQKNCGLHFVDNLLYCERTNNPNFRIETKEEQKMNNELYIDLNNECYFQE